MPIYLFKAANRGSTSGSFAELSIVLDVAFSTVVVFFGAAFSSNVAFMGAAFTSFGVVRTAVIFDLTKSFLAEPCCVFTFIVSVLFNGFLAACVVGFGVLGNSGF